MQPCACNDPICVLPLGVAFSRPGKRRFTWGGRHVNAYLREDDFRMETLQREGRALFVDARNGCTVDFSAAYHHVHMRPDASSTLSGRASFTVFGCCHSAWQRARGFLRHGSHRDLSVPICCSSHSTDRPAAVQ